MRRRACISPTALAILLFFLAQGSAHEGATGIVKERMDVMDAMSKSMKAIKQHLEANRKLAAIQEEAGHIRDTALRIAQWFPPGSDYKPTDALPAIWQRWVEFQAKAAKLQQESMKLGSVAASGDPQSIAVQFRVVGQACTGCHDTFRAKR